MLWFSKKQIKFASLFSNKIFYMYKHITFFIALVVFSACSDSIIQDTSAQKAMTQPLSVSVERMFDTRNWEKCGTFQDKLNACQIPDSIMSYLSTNDLVFLLASHPLNAICYAYDNPMVGANYIMQNFNGFSELIKRKDFAEAAIDFYEGIDYSNIEKSPHPITIRDGKGRALSFSNLAFFEMVMSTEAITKLAEDAAQLKRLEQVATEKYDQKLEQIETLGALALVNSLKILSQTTIRTRPLPKEETDVLRKFLEQGGPIDITEVSKIVFTYKSMEQ